MVTTQLAGDIMTVHTPMLTGRVTQVTWAIRHGAIELLRYQYHGTQPCFAQHLENMSSHF